MGEENFIYHYVNLPNVHISQPEENIEMINILTPLISVDDKKSLFDQTILKSEVTYDCIIQSKDVDVNINVEKPTQDTVNDLKRSERLQKDILRKKMARLRESAEQRVERLKKDRMRKMRARQNETNEQRQKRLEKDRIRIQKRRALETDEERQRRLEKNRISKRKARLKEIPRICEIKCE
ncbi:hypothetical protein RDWZM_008127 [Blomia tropicalis]|uniref:Uncharacterized protein n=1 Tax=Blomia tropicalis TaxID=40697 RepID=A0A9Q0RK26_BLOTA|nr:hypothetical protein BLOT_003839 [Blomia tropicalis]KAJ6216970.1 hypothetical protein RDWZM_008127 [Blomia tropicalis]